MIQPSKIAFNLFVLCARLLVFLGKRFNLTYKAISVVVNLWFQGGVLLISGVLPLVKALAVSNQSVALVGWLAYALVYVCGFAWILCHYKLPFERAFDLCVADLIWLSDKCRLSYHAINLIIFVGIFLFLIALNVLLYIMI